MDRLAVLPRATELEQDHAAALEYAASLPATAHITLVTSLAGLLSLEQNWRALEKSAQASPTVFQSFDWVSAWCRTYCANQQCPDIHIIAGFDNNRLVFVWPLMRIRRAGLSILCWLTEPFGQYGDVLCAEGHCARMWVANAPALHPPPQGH
jgi:CelD/BcsL family acetyltransferase involved in cellulose biosynthesis